MDSLNTGLKSERSGWLTRCIKAKTPDPLRRPNLSVKLGKQNALDYNKDVVVERLLWRRLKTFDSVFINREHLVASRAMAHLIVLPLLH